VDEAAVDEAAEAIGCLAPHFPQKRSLSLATDPQWLQ